MMNLIFIYLYLFIVGPETLIFRVCKPMGQSSKYLGIVQATPLDVDIAMENSTGFCFRR